jgi:hypothetical protein
MLTLPLIAMRFTDEVDWTAGDFLIFGLMLLAVGIAYELAVRMSRDVSYRVAAGLALTAGFLLVWANLAVGIIGDEGDPANLMFGGVLLIGVIGAGVAKMKPRGMALTSLVMAVAQVLVAVIAWLSGLDQLWIVTGFLVALWLTSAGLFHKAARTETAARPPSAIA